MAFGGFLCPKCCHPVQDAITYRHKPSGYVYRLRECESCQAEFFTRQNGAGEVLECLAPDVLGRVRYRKKQKAYLSLLRTVEATGNERIKRRLERARIATGVTFFDFDNGGG